MLKSAREAGDGSWAGGDDENSTLIDLAEQQFAGALAAGGGLGIAKMVTAGLAARSDHPTE
jgi:Rod binding domain-containing protein